MRCACQGAGLALVTGAMKKLTIIPPDHPLRGRVSPPGSKSITNRALLLAGLASGESRLTGALKSDDTRYMAEALRAMGVAVTEPDPTTFVVHGTGKLNPPAAPLFLGNAGTATRFLTATLALGSGRYIVDGDEHMRKRPIGPLVEALRSLGVDIEAPTGCPPVTIIAKGSFSRNRVVIDAGLSSQYVSAILMAAPLAHETFTVELSGAEIGARGYIELTTAAMATFGAQITQVSPSQWQVAPSGYKAANFHIEPDASAATYMWAAEALTGGDIDLGVGHFTQPDAKARDVIASYPHMPDRIDGSQMQDAVPTLAVLAAFNTTPVRFVGIANLRVKECDRIRALSLGLNAIREGLAHEDGDDLVVNADPTLAGQTQAAEIDTFADHRIAMSFALAGLKVRGITIRDPDCVGKTYPDYWATLASLGVKTEIEAATLL
jgi:3-phosphoshikimate 1-carboxyvinyltransferase